MKHLLTLALLVFTLQANAAFSLFDVFKSCRSTANSEVLDGKGKSVKLKDLIAGTPKIQKILEDNPWAVGYAATLVGLANLAPKGEASFRWEVSTDKTRIRATGPLSSYIIEIRLEIRKGAPPLQISRETGMSVPTELALEIFVEPDSLDNYIAATKEAGIEMRRELKAGDFPKLLATSNSEVIASGPYKGKTRQVLPLSVFLDVDPQNPNEASVIPLFVEKRPIVAVVAFVYLKKLVQAAVNRPFQRIIIMYDDQ